MKIWSLSKRHRLLKRARLLDEWARRIRARVKAHTPKRRQRAAAEESPT
jgi:hypothetical protein